MANYRVEYTTEDLKWPAYVSTVTLEGDRLEKAEKVLENALITLEAYGGPRLLVHEIKAARRTGIFLYEISCLLIDTHDEMKACFAIILNEPWMKANSVAAASFEFAKEGDSSDDNVEKLVMKRKKTIKYYKDSEIMQEEEEEVQHADEGTETTAAEHSVETERITDV